MGEETCLDRESQPGKNNAGRVDTIPGGQRLFVRDGKLYYLATVSSIGRDSFRVDFDDGSFSEVSRASLQRSAVSPKLCPGDVLVSNTQKKQGLQQRYTYIEQQASTSEKALKKDAMIKVRPVSARHSLGEVKEVVDDEDIVQMSISSMALVAGPNIQDKSRAIDVNHLFPSLESTSIGTSRVKTGQKIVRTDMLKGIGLLLTSVHSIWDTSALVFSVSNGAIVIENLDSIVGFALSKADSKGKSKATCGGNALSSLNTILLVSPGHVTTPKYLKALALGIPCVSATWLEDCAHQHERLSWKPYACESPLTEQF